MATHCPNNDKRDKPHPELSRRAINFPSFGVAHSKMGALFLALAFFLPPEEDFSQ